VAFTRDATPSDSTARIDAPWFQRRPRVSIGVAAVLYAGIFALRMTTGTAIDATTMFFVLPIALLAVTFGRVAGLVAGLVAVGLVAVWAFTDQVGLSPVGWVTRVLPMLLLGLLLGQASDRLRRSEALRLQLAKAAHWHREAVEINDSIVQGLAAAKWSLEAGHTDSGLRIVTETLDHAQTMVSQLLRDAELAPGAAHAPGSLAALSPPVDPPSRSRTMP
jgi:glucose-6-phosphate-specific signal transduction histidine kinase